MRLYRSDDPVHMHAASVLPWYVNETLCGPEQARVADHVTHCAACRREVQALQALRAAVAAEAPDPGLSGSLQRMHAMLDAEDSRKTALPRWLAQQWQSAPLFARALVAVQTALLLVVASAVWVWQSPSTYHTLSTTQGLSGKGASLMVVFAEGRSEVQIRELLADFGARIIEGPNTAGAYIVGVPKDHEREVLLALRARPEVKFAEFTSLPTGVAP